MHVYLYKNAYASKRIFTADNSNANWNKRINPSFRYVHQIGKQGLKASIILHEKLKVHHSCCESSFVQSFIFLRSFLGNEVLTHQMVEPSLITQRK